MPEFRQPAERQNRLFRVELPWMQINHGSVAAALSRTDCMRRQPQRKQPEISAAASRQIAA